MLKQSLTYNVTLAIIKLKGLKQKFSQDPIDYIAIRKEDVYKPIGSFFKKYITNTFQIVNTSITEIVHNDSNKLILFINGGAFISGPAQHHWDTIKEITMATNYTVWLCNYPKAPENSIEDISKNVDAVYAEALKRFEPKNIILLGDSVGGTLITALTQRLLTNRKELPKKLILVSPVMDASFSNPDIDTIDPIDPMLSKKGLLSAKKMCAKDKNLKDPIISPIYGSFEGFPETILFAAERDITYPDQILAYEKANKAKADIRLIQGKNMPHIWPLLPIMKEAKMALDELITIVNE